MEMEGYELEISGELVFLGATPLRHVTVTATTFCDVRIIYNKSFRRITEKFPEAQRLHFLSFLGFLGAVLKVLWAMKKGVEIDGFYDLRWPEVEATLSKFDGGRPMNAKAAGKLGRAMAEALAQVFQPLVVELTI